MTFRRKAIISVALVILILWYGPLLLALTKSIFARRAAPPVQAAVSAQPSTTNDTFSYPEIGVTAPMTVSQQTNPTVTADWSKFRNALLHGVSLSFEGPSFTSSPLVFVVGHSSDSYPHPYSTILAPLSQGKVGDIVDVFTNNTDYQFKVIDKTIISPSDVGKFMSYAPTDPHIQRLEIVTCWPIFTSAKRLTLIAERTIASN